MLGLQMHAEITDACCHFQLYTDIGDPNSGPYTFTARALLTEPSPRVSFQSSARVGKFWFSICNPAGWKSTAPLQFSGFLDGQ